MTVDAQAQHLPPDLPLGLYRNRRWGYIVNVTGEWLDGTVYYERDDVRQLCHMHRDDFLQRFERA